MSQGFADSADIRARGERLRRSAMDAGGTGPERERAMQTWIDFCDQHETTGRQLTFSSGSGNGGSSPSRSWNERAENVRFVDRWHWNVCLATMPIGSGFRAEINTVITAMKAHQKYLERNNSQYGESYLVGWILHHMPAPAAHFLRWSLHEEESSESDWTIMAAEQHLYAWAGLFESTMADKYVRECGAIEESRYANEPSSEWKEKYLYSEQRLGGGGPYAHFLWNRPEHRRWAYQMFRTLWRDCHERWATQLGGRPPREVVMTD